MPINNRNRPVTPNSYQCVCRGLGAYVELDETETVYVVRGCDDHPPSTEDGLAYLQIDRILQAAAEVRDILWPDDNPDSEWTADEIDHVAQAFKFLRPTEEAA